MPLVPDTLDMSRQLRIALIAAAVPVALILWASAVFAMDRVSNGGEVLGNVTVAGADLGGLSEDEARDALLALEERLSTVPITVTVAGETFSLLPSEVGFSIDVETMLADAMRNGREGGVPGQFGWWIGNLTGGGVTPIPLATGYSQNELNDVLDRWVVESIDNPAFEGGIEVVERRGAGRLPQDRTRHRQGAVGRTRGRSTRRLRPGPHRTPYPGHHPDPHQHRTRCDRRQDRSGCSCAHRSAGHALLAHPAGLGQVQPGTPRGVTQRPPRQPRQR